MKSFWEEARKNEIVFESVNKDINVSVCIIGGGFTGLSCGYYLSKSNSVAIVEKDKICSHTSGNTTGKITSQHGTLYDYLISSKGEEFATKYLEANEKAINNIEQIINSENIDCDFKRESAYIFTTKQPEVDKIKKEHIAVEKIQKGHSKLVKEIELPLEVKGAMEFPNQAKFHPIKYGYGLAESITKNNGKIYEYSQVTNIKKENGKYAVYVNNHVITADYVIIATRYPIINFPGYYFLKMYQSTSFAIVTDTKEELFNGLYISLEAPTISFRVIEEGDKKLLLTVGYDYKTGTNEITDGYKNLEKVVKRMYPKSEILYSWTAEDCISLDKIPYIGRFSKIMQDVYVATGFNKWGITSSNIAANIITDKIQGKENEYEEIFEATRMEPVKNKEEVGNMLTQVSKSLVVSKFKIPEEKLRDIAEDEGKIIEIGNEKVGVYKSKTGEIFKIKPTCTHLGCELYFNNIDKIWECPCHGSKFSYDGSLIEMPANEDLKEI